MMYSPIIQSLIDIVYDYAREVPTVSIDRRGFAIYLLNEEAEKTNVFTCFKYILTYTVKP